MTVMVDTNILLDVFIRERSESFPESVNVMKKILADDANICLVSASAVTDIYYILRKAYRSAEVARTYIKTLNRYACISDVREDDIRLALDSEMPDFEDSVVDCISFRLGCDYILTRNECDFAGSHVKAITPEAMISML